MITLSDNTATDMLWRLVGLGSVNETMRELDLATIDCVMPNREYFLMECGAGSDWRGLSGAETVAKWRSFEARDERAGSLRSASSRRTRASVEPGSSISTTSAGGSTNRAATTTPSPSTRRSTTRARRATWPSCWR